MSTSTSGGSSGSIGESSGSHHVHWGGNAELGGLSRVSSTKKRGGGGSKKLPTVELDEDGEPIVEDLVEGRWSHTPPRLRDAVGEMEDLAIVQIGEDDDEAQTEEISGLSAGSKGVVGVGAAYGGKVSMTAGGDKDVRLPDGVGVGDLDQRLKGLIDAR